MNTRVLSTDSPGLRAAAVTEAVRLLEAGETVAVPTETVYGLAADALRPDAVARIFEAKERPFFDPLICHLPSLTWLPRMAAAPDGSQALVQALTEAFWPGPLTLVLPRRPMVPDLVTAGAGTVALRMSAHSLFQEILQRFGKPLAAPSANRFGRISPTRAEHALAELNGRIPLILDGGAAGHGIESTIIAVQGDNGLLLLRAGPILEEQLLAVAGTYMRERVIQRPDRGADPGGALPAPGALASHYAPRTPLRLLEAGETAGAIQTFGRVGYMAYEGVPDAKCGYIMAQELTPSGDLKEAAANLFATLRRLDEAGLDLIVAESVPETGLGIAIMDRLRKASARMKPS